MVTIIIPACHEAGVIAPTLAAALAQPGPAELLVVDAGSADATAEIAACSGARVIASPVRQRAAQMNLGAHHAQGEILLFLHADTLLPPAALRAIGQVLQNPCVVGGAFARQFQSPSLFLRVTARLTGLRNHTVGWHLGDQAIFVRRQIFEKLGGYPLWDRFEDLEFSRQLSRAGDLATLRPPVITSARRFEKLGPARQTLRDFLLTLRYLSGNRAVCHTGKPPRLTHSHAPEQPS